MNKHLILGIFISTLVGAPACGHLMGGSHPEANTSTQRTSRTGMYEVTYQPHVVPIPKRELHAWQVNIRTKDGSPVDGANIQVGGGMPDHGHGLPTQPRVRAASGHGVYIIDGVKFNMGGYWVVDLNIDAPQGRDSVRFELNL